MSAHIIDRLSEARRRQFVGRAAERHVFVDTLTARELPYQLLYVFGPGGVGKTSLLREYAEMCKQVETPAVYMDARGIEPSPGGFVNALKQALELPPADSVFQTLASRHNRYVILLDTYETLEPLDGWLRDTFLPQLPENVLVVLAGRNLPAPPWRSATSRPRKAVPIWNNAICPSNSIRRFWNSPTGIPSHSLSSRMHMLRARESAFSRRRHQMSSRPSSSSLSKRCRGRGTARRWRRVRLCV